jgi:hypothetical protein
MPTMKLSSWMGHPNFCGCEKMKNHGLATRHQASHSSAFGLWSEILKIEGDAIYLALEETNIAESLA